MWMLAFGLFCKCNMISFLDTYYGALLFQYKCHGGSWDKANRAVHFPVCFYRRCSVSGFDLHFFYSQFCGTLCFSMYVRLVVNSSLLTCSRVGSVCSYQRTMGNSIIHLLRKVWCSLLVMYDTNVLYTAVVFWDVKGVSKCLHE
jgi:hypothetical protein